MQPGVVVTVLWMELEMEVVTVMVEMEMGVVTVVGVILVLVMPKMAVTVIFVADGGASGIEKQNLTGSPCPPRPQTRSIWRANGLTGRRRGASGQ